MRNNEKLKTQNAKAAFFEFIIFNFELERGHG